MSNEIRTRPLTPIEQKYTYAQSMQLEGQTGTIGHLRGDFAISASSPVGRSVLPYDSQKRVSPEMIVSSKIYEPQPLVCPGVVIYLISVLPSINLSPSLSRISAENGLSESLCFSVRLSAGLLRNSLFFSPVTILASNFSASCFA